MCSILQQGDCFWKPELCYKTPPSAIAPAGLHDVHKRPFHAPEHNSLNLTPIPNAQHGVGCVPVQCETLPFVFAPATRPISIPESTAVSQMAARSLYTLNPPHIPNHDQHLSK